LVSWLGKLQGAVAYFLWHQEWGFSQFVGSIGFPRPLFFAGCAMLSECVGGQLLAIGLVARYAAALIAISMSVAVYFHLRTDMGFELAGLYLIASFLLCWRVRASRPWKAG